MRVPAKRHFADSKAKAGRSAGVNPAVGWIKLCKEHRGGVLEIEPGDRMAPKDGHRARRRYRYAPELPGLVEKTLVPTGVGRKHFTGPHHASIF